MRCGEWIQLLLMGRGLQAETASAYLHAVTPAGSLLARWNTESESEVFSRPPGFAMLSRGAARGQGSGRRACRCGRAAPCALCRRSCRCELTCRMSGFPRTVGIVGGGALAASVQDASCRRQGWGGGGPWDLK